MSEYNQIADRTVTFVDSETLDNQYRTNRAALEAAIANITVWAFRDSLYRTVRVRLVEPEPGSVVILANYQDRYGDRESIVRTGVFDAKANAFVFNF